MALLGGLMYCNKLFIQGVLCCTLANGEKDNLVTFYLNVEKCKWDHVIPLLKNSSGSRYF